MEVAPTVRIERTSGVVVPTAKISVTVVGATKVPKSVQPDAPEEQDAQVSPPEPSFCKHVLADCDEGQEYVSPLI